MGPYPHGGELIDPSGIDIAKIRKWVSACEEEHRCGSSPRSVLGMPKLLVIDVNEECLVTLTQPMPYLVLSYVWGNGNTLLLTQENYSALSSKRSLRQCWDEIPCTIRDAIVLTRNLSFRYLWVDQLCIIQDDTENKMTHIARMDSIYANASITIVAADGENSHQGLKGVKGGSNPQRAPQDVLDFSPLGKILISSRPFDDQERPTYFSRGWTFQEYHLSNRLLAFIDNKVIWRCREFEWQEGRRDPIDNDGDDQFLPVPKMTSQMIWPDMWAYLPLVKEYNARTLGYDADVLSAFAGVLKAINPAFPSGFLQGLPEFYFDVALLWQPARPLRRRNTLGDQYSPPSWSWVGWAGELDLELCEDGLESPHSKSYDMITSPLTNWHKLEKPYGVPSPVANDYHRYLQLRVPNFAEQNLDASEPDFLTRVTSVHSGITGLSLTGWRLSASVLDRSGAQERHPEPWPCYRHRSIQEAGGFSWPVPVGNNQESLQSPDLVYLQFRASRAYFDIGVLLNRQLNNDYIECCSVTITDPSGAIAGILRLNTVDPPNVDSDLKSCELIAISTGMANLRGIYPSNTLDEASDVDCLTRIIELRGGSGYSNNDAQGIEGMDKSLRNSIGVYEWYNVLWVQRKDGIAYRKALGRVFKEAWEAQALEWVDIILE